ncbi:tol-pal system-associated acyl-CoA thioesterase [Paracoccus aestuarii]|uniref:Tol-pal system-associated acyl-CoA thioesterase n=1 Tax=Paracoccus aestuarii TaxID=453842 RepID=A0A418ZV50_9RHOB|nr:tol-pal system-associated acyl-CoA thioesterase [Paracoccus aestuarii]RJL02311.1 tol-pal system-associated acyl-CoA thioesterase [Paracoccus aestuarii]WCQ98726.1 tol-pal system-associated acyl-CoA thioesterase [Paracoccus aestuarii]
MSHDLTLRVYYEDTDLAGIVYYANYLKFIERGRSEWLRDLGIDQVAMKAQGAVFAVRSLQADYLQPARFDDLLVVRTGLARMTAARIEVDQAVLRDGRAIFTARVVLACLDGAGRPLRLPGALRAAMAPLAMPAAPA